MGASPTPVNIWYWKAAESSPQNLAAAGFGSTTRINHGALIVESHYRDAGEWVVVFSRSIETEGEYQANLNVGLVENYAGTICPHCDSEFEMFP